MGVNCRFLCLKATRVLYSNGCKLQVSSAENLRRHVPRASGDASPEIFAPNLGGRVAGYLFSCSSRLPCPPGASLGLPGGSWASPGVSATGPAPGTQKVFKVCNCHQKQAWDIVPARRGTGFWDHPGSPYLTLLAY